MRRWDTVGNKTGKCSVLKELTFSQRSPATNKSVRQLHSVVVMNSKEGNEVERTARKCWGVTMVDTVANEGRSEKDTRVKPDVSENADKRT